MRWQDEIGIDVPVHAIDGALWLRVSAAAYNAPAEYEALADRLPALLSR